MHLSISLRILGLLLALFSVTMLPPLAFAFVLDEGTVRAFSLSFNPIGRRFGSPIYRIARLSNGRKLHH